MAGRQERGLGTAIFSATFGLVGIAVGALASYSEDATTLHISMGACFGAVAFSLLGWFIGWRMFRQLPGQPPLAPSDPDVERPWQPRFHIRTIFLITFVVSIAAAAGYYMIQALEASKTAKEYDVDRRDVFYFLAFTFIAPVIIMVLLSTVWGLFPGRRNRK